MFGLKACKINIFSSLLYSPFHAQPSLYTTLYTTFIFCTQKSALLLHRAPSLYRNNPTIFFISSALVSGRTWLYKSIVMLNLLCPRIVFNTCGGIPFSIYLVANVWRKVCGVILSNSIPAFCMFLVILSNLFTLSLSHIWRPVRCVNTRLSSSGSAFHISPSSIRLCFRVTFPVSVGALARAFLYARACTCERPKNLAL